MVNDSDWRNVMINSALTSQKGGRLVNEDYVTIASHGDDMCYILCDGLGGHECGDVAAETVATFIAHFFEENGDSSSFLDDAIKLAQEKLISVQEATDMIDAMKTTLVVLVVTSEHIKWAHIGDSRLYRVYNNGSKYQRTKDHSLVQHYYDRGEITEDEIRKHPDRNKLLRAMGATWEVKSYDKSPVIERGEKQGFALMSDGFWEYVLEDEMMEIYRNSTDAKAWLEEMQALVEARADIRNADNYSAICVMVDN